MKLTVYGPLRSATGEKTVELVTEGTVENVLEALIEEYPRTVASPRRRQ